MNSCLYVGRLRHRRLIPKPHVFDYGLFMVYLDLSELKQVFQGRWLWAIGRRNLIWLRRADYLGHPDQALDESVRRLVQEHSGIRPLGPIRMLTHLRTLGHCFNPVTFYYCFTADGRSVETIVSEITNTPWNERHSYVLQSAGQAGPVHRFRFAKSFHVSPFFPMDMDYDWQFSEPGERLTVHMKLEREGTKSFDATLDLQRREINGLNLALALIRFPLMTLKVVAAIYWQAALLKLKGTPFHDHPATPGEHTP